MGTVLRPELAASNKYRLDKHRHYELKHFCLQYPLWEAECRDLDGYRTRVIDPAALTHTKDISNPVAQCVEAREYYTTRMELVIRAAEEAEMTIAGFLLKAVTQGLSYDHLRTKLGMPCGKDFYYERYRRFFWLLNISRR